MSISGSLSSALSGLTAASKAAEVVSSNIANATTEGYARREVLTVARSVGANGNGVRVIGVQRQTDVALLNDRRIAEASQGNQDLRASFLKGLEEAIGTPDSAISLGTRLSDFDTALLEAVSRPDSEARLTNVLDTAKALADHISRAAETVQAARASADDGIEAQVRQLNTALSRIAELNGQIRTSLSGTHDPSALMDQRQQLIDSISGILPIREVARDSGQVALFTTNGATLLDGKAAVFGFSPAGIVTADMSITNGTLSGLTLNGRAVATDRAEGPIAGGSLAASFALRDDLAVEAQTKLDALARDLVERFSASGLDPTRSSGDAGLFTDGGTTFQAANEKGLAQRLAVNAAVDPGRGGAVTRLRDGMEASTPGPTGNSTLLDALHTALTTTRIPVSGGFSSGARSFATLQADLLSSVSGKRLGAQSEASYAAARSDALKSQELAGGVDTDQELQSLLLIEQAYTANAKVMQTIGQMVDILLGI